MGGEEQKKERAERKEEGTFNSIHKLNANSN